MKKILASIPLLATLLLFSGCYHLISNYKSFTDEQLQEYTTCKAELSEAKARLEAAGYDIMTDREKFFITDWKVDNTKTIVELYGKGKLFIKYKVRDLGNGYIQWTEIQSYGRDGEGIENDLYIEGPKDILERQAAVVKLICGCDKQTGSKE